MKCIVPLIVLYFLAFSVGCEDQYNTLEDPDRYTSLDFLTDSQSIEIDQIILGYLNAYDYIRVGLVDKNGLVFVCSYGSDRIGKSDVYASVSKPVTAMIFFQVLEEGTIASVNDPIGDYSDKYNGVMPDEYSGSPITFMHLLSHQSGIPHHDRIWDQGKLKLEFEPGKGVLYSTRGYGVLGEILCEITGLNYSKLIEEYIAKPINASSFNAPSLLFEAPGGLVKSNIFDMALFANSILNDAYVSDSTKLNIQWIPYAQDNIGDIGLGWYLSNYNSDSLAVFHAGSNGKPRAFIALRPLQDIGVVLLGKNKSSSGEQQFYGLAKDLVMKMKEINRY